MAEMNINLSRVTRFYWKISWKYTTPCILTILLIFSWRNFGNVKYKDEIYPVWVQILGYLITGCTLLALPIAGACEALARYRDTTKLVSALFSPTQQWGPNNYNQHDLHI